MSETSTRLGEGDLLARASRSQLLDVVECSPRAVAVHDKQAWLGLFAEGGVVEDPVGTPTCRKGAFTLRSPRGDDDLGCFYDTFIAPNRVRFAIERDLVVGSDVMRDAVLHIDMASGLHVEVPAHLLYQLTEEAGEIRVARMAAHWEAGPLRASILAAGLAGYRNFVTSGLRMLRTQGLRYALDYQRGTGEGMGEMGHAALQIFADTLNTGKGEAVAALFATPDSPIGFPAGQSIPARSLIERVGEKAELEVSKLRSSGWTCSCSFELRRDGREQAGVALFDFDPQSRRVVAAHFYFEE
ncbi:MAG: hypothetical protein JRG96_03210 [Deltaproteobacteria bacterium]|nr:hypothetical protein [Deltaproteobacteria bacterium]MBW2420222.1 hypothetical protein [Deltaproteobacteria bacterium]